MLCGAVDKSLHCAKSVYSLNSGDEVAGQKYRVGFQLVDAVDGVAEKEGLGEHVQVNVAELDDAHAVKCGVQAGEMDIVVRNLKKVALDFARIKRETGRAAEHGLCELTPIDFETCGRAGIRHSSYGIESGESCRRRTRNRSSAWLIL